MRTNYGNCASGSRSVGRIPAEDQSTIPLGPRSQIEKKTAASNSSPLSYIISNNVFIDENNIIDVKFSQAMHSTATTFSFFDVPA